MIRRVIACLEAVHNGMTVRRRNTGRRNFWAGLLVVLFALPSCLLDQNAPKPPAQPATPQTLGYVVMEDISGPGGQMADVMAIFGREASKRSLGRYLRHLNQGREIEIPIANRAPGAPAQCSVAQEAVETRAVERGTISLVSVGRLSVGFALSHNLISIGENADHIYSRELNPDFPAGDFQIVGEGKGDVAAFAELLSMPEALRGVKAAGTAFGGTVIPVDRTQGVEMEWEAPGILSDLSVMIFDIATVVENTRYILECEVLEKDVYTSASVLQWKIPASELEKLPASASGQIQLQRIHELGSAGRGIDGKLQGTRVQVALSSLN